MRLLLTAAAAILAVGIFVVPAQAGGPSYEGFYKFFDYDKEYGRHHKGHHHRHHHKKHEPDLSELHLGYPDLPGGPYPEPEGPPSHEPPSEGGGGGGDNGHSL